MKKRKTLLIVIVKLTLYMLAVVLSVLLFYLAYCGLQQYDSDVYTIPIFAVIFFLVVDIVALLNCPNIVFSKHTE